MSSIPVIVVGARGKRLGEPVIEAINNSGGADVMAEIVRPGDERRSPFGHLVRHSFSEISDLRGEDGTAREEVVVFYAVKADALGERLAEAVVSGFRRHVIGTTGFSTDVQAIINTAACSDMCREQVVVVAPNFSTGANVCAEQCAVLARQFPEAEVEIMEAHHNQKADSPSGTALYWARAIVAARGQKPEDVIKCGRMSGKSARDKDEIFVHSLRGGSVTGWHQATFFCPDDEVVIEHNARSSRLFAQGALTAICWAGARELKTVDGGLTETQQAELASRARPYYMCDVLGLALLQELGVH